MASLIKKRKKSARKKAEKKERRCLVNRTTHKKTEMIRFVVAPNGEIAVDLAAKLPGRGIWIIAKRDAIEEAIKANLFAKGAKRKVAIPDGLADNIEALLLKRVKETIGLAKKAGLSIAGLEKVKARLLKLNSSKGLLLVAKDAGRDADDRILPLADGWRLIRSLDGTILGASQGRQRTVYITIEAGKLSSRVENDIKRLHNMQK